jgi:predicted acyltransferase
VAAPVETRIDETKSSERASGGRLVSLDALRGFDMFWIIGGDYVVRSLPKIHDSGVTRGLAAQMEHCEWAGLHFYDAIFPLFVFIVGVSLVFSVGRMIERGGRGAAVKRIIARSLILLLLGIFYMGGVANGFHNVYFAGVLHRIAVAYFFAALLYCFFRMRTLIWVCATLLVGYWVLMTFVPVPGIGAPDLTGPGRNLAHYLDERFLPGQKFEGTLLSTMAAVANCLLGVFAGGWLKSERVPESNKVRWLALGGVASLALGLVWALQFPVIKLLWTSSYVLVSCGISALLLAVFYQVIERWKFQEWAQPFVWVGMNALTIYLVANMVNFHRLAERFVGGDIKSWLGPYGDLVTGLTGLLLALWLVRFLHHRKLYLRL